MKKTLSILSILFISSLLTASIVKAQKAKTMTSSGLLYQITGKGLKKPSYIFGTIHLICEKDMFPAEKLKSYVGQTEQLMLEFDLDNQTEILKATKGFTLADGKTMKDFLKPEEYIRIDKMFRDYLGVSYDRFQTFKPSVVSVFLLMSPKVLGCPTPQGYDSFLARTAAANKMPVLGLETIEEQLAALDSLPFDKQTEALNKMALNPEKSFDDFKSLYQIYLAQDPDELYNLGEKQFKSEGYSTAKLLDERNANWIPVIEKNIQTAPSFIGVGAGHLGGKKGVISLLRARGYKVTPIKL